MVITQTCEDIYLNFLYIDLNVIRLSSYLLFTLLDLGLYSKHHLRVMDSLYYPSCHILVFQEFPYHHIPYSTVPVPVLLRKAYSMKFVLRHPMHSHMLHPHQNMIIPLKSGKKNKGDTFQSTKCQLT